MKTLSIFVLLVLSFVVHAANKQVYTNEPNPVIRSSHDITYVCTQYTSNEYVNKKVVTDNAPVTAKTTVIQTKEGFIINKGRAFAERHILTNNQLGSANGMAGDPTTLLLKKDDGYGNVYFVTYVFEDPSSPQAKEGIGPVKELVVMAGCTANK